MSVFIQVFIQVFIHVFKSMSRFIQDNASGNGQPKNLQCLTLASKLFNLEADGQPKPGR